MSNKDWSYETTSILQKSIGPIVGFVVVALIGGGVYAYMSKQSHKKLEKQSEELFVLQKELAKKGQEMASDEPEFPMLDKKPAKPKKPKPTVAELEAAYSPIVAKLQAFIKANGGTQPAVEAALLVSEAASEYQKYDEGVSALQTALKDFSSKSFLYGVAQSELGSMLAQTDKCQEATQVWEKLASSKNHDYVTDQIRLKSGVCYEKLGQYEKAEKLYKDVIQKSPESFNARTAKRFLLYLQYVRSKTAEGQEPKNG